VRHQHRADLLDGKTQGLTMPDAIDLVQQRGLEERERQIIIARRRPVAASRFMCECGGGSIPAARRVAVPGVVMCVTCQGIYEEYRKHFKG